MSAHPPLVNVIVAHSEVDGRHLDVRLDGPPQLHVPRGAHVQVKHAYRFDETFGRIEDCRFSLTADLDGEGRSTKTAAFHDRFGHRSLLGYLMQEFVVAEPGRHDLHFAIGLDYGQQTQSGVPQRSAHESKSGSVRLIVD